MGNVGSNNSNGRRRHGGGGNRRENNQDHLPPPPQQQQPAEINTNQYVFAAASPYPNHNPNLPPQAYHQHPTGVYYPPQPLTAPFPAPAWVGGRYPCVPVMHHPAPYVDHQKAMTIRNDINLKKESFKIEPDEEHLGKFLVQFTYDATVAGSITIYFFAKEGKDCNMTPTNTLQPITVRFQQGLGQRFRQEASTGIELSTFEESELTKVSKTGVYPLVIKAEATPYATGDESTNHKSINSQITQAVFEKDKGTYHVRVVKQILWANGMRYELQEIYGIGNSVDAAAADIDGNDPGKECVICLSEPRDTTVLPCRHMCMCSGCAKVLRFQTNRCPICRQPVERLLEIKVSSGAED